MKLYQKILAASTGTVGLGVVGIKTLFPWLKYDIEFLRAAKKVIKERDEAVKTFLVDVFESHAANDPNKPLLIFEDCVYTYKFIDEMANRVANWGRSFGLKQGDTVSIIIQNEPAFLWTFLGFQKLGISVAFINYNLRLLPLTHSVTSAEPKILIVGKDQLLLDAVTDILDKLNKIQVFAQGLGSLPPPPGIISFDPLMWAALPVPISKTYRAEVKSTDTSMFIYTSGTTGNPKPVHISQAKVSIASIFAKFLNFDRNDIMYTCLPLYHSAGGGLGMFSVLRTGATMVLRQKFSAHHFWEDCCKHNVTVIQYIGELFRYLLAHPPSEFEHKHQIRAALGNGMRKDIWLQVFHRFKIPHIYELYGATEGPAVLINLSNRPGAIGRLSPFINKIDPDPKALVKFDYATAQPIRDKDGRCIPVKIGEPGLFIASVPEMLKLNGSFAVYKSTREANDKKLVRDAFKTGDLYFNFGDVLVTDSDYFLYFHDRIGDTFRWKGENVSTTELANIITTLPFVHDANVYGVLIPGSDGRAGMVSLTLNDGKHFGTTERKSLYDFVCAELPTYARPLFVRILDEAIMTGTFKQQKVQLIKEGYDSNIVKDPLFAIDNTKKTYSPLTEFELNSFLSSKL